MKIAAFANAGSRPAGWGEAAAIQPVCVVRLVPEKPEAKKEPPIGKLLVDTHGFELINEPSKKQKYHPN